MCAFCSWNLSFIPNLNARKNTTATGWDDCINRSYSVVGCCAADCASWLEKIIRVDCEQIRTIRYMN
jgi:hypothetical protein